jgi:hypothetical protein
VLGVVGVVALSVRLTPILTGGGLRFWGRYDDGVYYTASASLLDGRLPYRDFVLLHPPLITLVLLPFTLLGRLTSDPTGLVAARITWMLLGSATAVLVARYAGRWGTPAALVAGLWFACSASAGYAAQTTFIEPAADLAMFGGVVLLSGDRVRPRRDLVAGLLLGIALTGKIWYVVPVGAVLIATLLDRRRASAARAGGVAVAAASAILLPFFALAPREMWHMVVFDQLSRPRHGRTSVIDRLGTAVGGRALGVSPNLGHVITALATAVFAVALVVCLRERRTRPVAAVALGTVGVLLVSPVVFHHYGDFTAASVAVTVAAGWSLLLRQVTVRRFAAGLGVVALVASGLAVATQPKGRIFPAVATASLPKGCITADDPTTLILANRLSSDLRAGCDVAVDVTGASYGVRVGRGKDLAYQDWLHAYLRSGSAMIVARRRHDGLHKSAVPALGTQVVNDGIVHVLTPSS